MVAKETGEETVKTLAKGFKGIEKGARRGMVNSLQRAIHSIGRDPASSEATKKAALQLLKTARANNIHLNPSPEGIARTINSDTMKNIVKEVPDFAKTLVTNSEASFFAGAIRNTSVSAAMGHGMFQSTFTSAGNVVKGGHGAFSLWSNLAVKVLRLGVANKIGKFFFGDPLNMANGVLATVGEYFYLRNPITVMGLMKKGEPFLANLDGMKKAEALGWWGDIIGERLKYLWEPWRELKGSVEMGVEDIAVGGIADIIDITTPGFVQDIASGTAGLVTKAANVIKD
jgi:hypothetical protein